MNTFAMAAHEFDAEKFKKRYKLTDDDFSVVTVNGASTVRISENVKNPPLSPIFDPPDPIPVAEVKTKHEYASELVELIAAALPKSDKDAIQDKLLRLTGELPPETKEAEKADAPLEATPGSPI